MQVDIWLLGLLVFRSVAGLRDCLLHGAVDRGDDSSSVRQLERRSAASEETLCDGPLHRARRPAARPHLYDARCEPFRRRAARFHGRRTAGRRQAGTSHPRTLVQYKGTQQPSTHYLFRAALASLISSDFISYELNWTGLDSEYVPDIGWSQLPLSLKAKLNQTVLTWQFPGLNLYLLV